LEDKACSKNQADLLITQIKQQYTSKRVVSGRPGKTRKKPTKWEKSRETWVEIETNSVPPLDEKRQY